ncbi:hypothetical protein NP493_4745g00000 [Ridgeia piscesae]|uniref:Uncharacterized protein n=1 Tax=Ridgeia piscesae TaxID=27915 RepID=A0AAD9MRH7_RIDPI|nr:hypothetical protein NP493_4745g00000 [Ridgeia piscesae]
MIPFIKVYLSHKKKKGLQAPLPTNLRQTATVASLKPDSAVLTTGEELLLDASSLSRLSLHLPLPSTLLSCQVEDNA